MAIDTELETLILYPCGTNGDSGFSWVEMWDTSNHPWDCYDSSFGTCIIVVPLLDMDPAWRTLDAGAYWVDF